MATKSKPAKKSSARAKRKAPPIDQGCSLAEAQTRGQEARREAQLEKRLAHPEAAASEGHGSFRNEG